MSFETAVQPRRVLLAAAFGTSVLAGLSGCAPLLVGGAMVGGTLMYADRRTSGAQIEDEAIELVALALVGRGTFDASEWDEALEAAEDDGRAAADFLLSLPLLGDYLENGLAAFELSCNGMGQIV